MGCPSVLSWCYCQGRGGSGVGLMPKEIIQIDGKWDSDASGIVGELALLFKAGGCFQQQLHGDEVQRRRQFCPLLWQ